MNAEASMAKAVLAKAIKELSPRVDI